MFFLCRRSERLQTIFSCSESESDNQQTRGGKLPPGGIVRKAKSPDCRVAGSSAGKRSLRSSAHDTSRIQVLIVLTLFF